LLPGTTLVTYYHITIKFILIQPFFIQAFCLWHPLKKTTKLPTTNNCIAYKCKKNIIILNN